MIQGGPIGAMLAKFCGEDRNIRSLLNDRGDSRFNLVTIAVGNAFVARAYPNIIYEIKHVT
jgi:hypothetical protein